MVTILESDSVGERFTAQGAKYDSGVLCEDTAGYLTVKTERGTSKLRWYHGLSRPLGRGSPFVCPNPVFLSLFFSEKRLEGQPHRIPNLCDAGSRQIRCIPLRTNVIITNIVRLTNQ